MLLTAAALVHAMTGAPDKEPGHRHPWDAYRHAVHWRVLVGGSGCMPGPAKCRADSGRTFPSFGGAVDLGYMFEGLFFFGLGYDFGLLHPKYANDPVRGMQKRGEYHGLFAMAKFHLPIHIFRPGLGLGPGWLRQSFVADDGSRRTRDALAGRISPSIDFTMSTRFFFGFSADFLINTARRKSAADVLGPTHAVVFGFNVGGGFP
jgi:hypothetical protein